MSTSDEEIRVLTASRDLDDYDIISAGALSVAVPYQTTESLRKLIWATMMTYSFGNSSVDHVVRRYGGLWERRTDKSFESDPRILILRSIYEDVAAIAGRLQSVPSSDTLGHVCAKSALCRLEATFKAAYGLIRRGYIFETDAVIRMLLEQLAWAHEAYTKSDQDVVQLNPTKCITPFKAAFKNAGTFYGELSEGAHIDPSVVQDYVRFHKQGSEVVARSHGDSQHSGYYYSALASVYLEVVQKHFSPFTESEFATIDERLRSSHRSYCEFLNADPHGAQ